MKFLLLFFSIFVVSQAQAEEKCLCGPYRHEPAFPGNSINHYRLLDGTINAALIRDTERTAGRKYLRTEIMMDWPGRKSGYIPAYDQLAEDGEKICVKGEVKVENAINLEGGSERLTFFETVENIYPFASQCEGEPITIHIDVVRKAELPD